MEQKKSQKSGSSKASNHEPTTNPGTRQAASVAVFDKIRQEIGKINPYAETIELTYHLRKFAELFRQHVKNDQMVKDLFAYLNEEALSNAMFAIQLATVFASHQLSDALIDESNVRNAMIMTLQQNFLSIERLKQENICRFYNSVTLLGEYYNRKRVAFGKRIHILGHSLVLLLTSELEQEICKSCQQPDSYRFMPDLAKLVLAQIIRNGEEVKEEHKQEIHDLMHTVRKTLIIIPNLCAQAKAFLLMTLDVYYGHMAGFDKLYSKYLKETTSEEVKAEEHATDIPIVVNGDEAPKENGVDTMQPITNEASKPSVTDEKTKQQQAKTQSENDASGQKLKGGKAGTSDRSSGRSGKASNQNNTTNDKENKKRSQTKPAVPVQKTSPKSTSVKDKRSISLHEDGNIVATITRRDTTAATAATTTSPTKKHPHNSSQHASNTPPSSSSTSKQKHSVRTTEKLATLPKITVTSATPSPRRTQDKHQPSCTSPRPVLGPSIAKQNRHPAPKSPTTRTDSRQGHPPVASTRHERNVRSQEPRDNRAEQRSRNGSDAFKLTSAEDQSSNHTPYVPEPRGWGLMPEPNPETVCTSSPASSSSRDKAAESYATANHSPTSPYFYEQDESLTDLIESMVVRPVNPQTASFLSFLARQ